MQLPQATVHCTFPKIGSPYLCNAAVNYLLQSCINGTKIIFFVEKSSAAVAHEL